MTRGPDELFDGRIADWLEADRDTAPKQALEVVLAAVPSIRQRRRGFRLGAWRTNQMIGSLKFAIAVAAALVVAVGGIYFLTPRVAPGPGSAVPATWVPYTSERFGYSLHHPADWTLKPSQFDWQPGVIHSDISEWPDEISDPKGGFTERGYTIYAGRQDLATGQTPDAWTAQYISKKALDAGGVCGDISAARYKPVEIDGETGQRVEMICAGSAFYSAAIVVHDGSAYLVAVATPSNTRDAKAVTIFDAVLASFRFAAS